MIFFITVLRSLAAMLITNSHYVGVYPTDLIANGGLLGDILFFAVSGFCLCNPKNSFPKWYGKRILRIYPQIILITVLYLILGIYKWDSHTALGWFVYPTAFRFISCIMLLYIPLYFLMKSPKIKRHIELVFLAVLLLQLVSYILFIDKTVYNVDSVGRWFIYFIFFESMLMGAYFRLNLDKYRDKNKLINWFLLAGSAVVYFASKTLFSKFGGGILYLQILNQYVLLALLWFIVRCFCGIDGKLERLPVWIKKIFELLSKITLEIYVVQIGIITPLAKLLPFPLNWILLTSVILIGALILHFVSDKLVSGITLLFKKIKNKAKAD